MKDGKEIASLTGLRFVAAFYVFVFHINASWPLTEIKLLNNIFEQGAIGMSLFFILSGFVLAHRYAIGHTSVKAYFANRFARIYPIYFTAALVTLPWVGLSFSGNSLFDIVKTILRGFILVFSNVFLIQAWFPQFFGYWNDGASWSISVEAFCYLIFPIIFPVFLGLSKKNLYFVFAGCYLLAVIPGQAGVLFPGSSLAVHYAMPIYRLPEFLIGVCTFLVLRNVRSSRFTQWHQLLFLVGLLAYLNFFGQKYSNFVGHNWIVVPFIAFMIFSLTSGDGVFAALLSHPVSVWLGRTSYCFYSFQVLVIKLFIGYHSKLLGLSPLFANANFIFCSALGVLFIFSAAGYYLIEEPFRRRLRGIYAS